MWYVMLRTRFANWLRLIRVMTVLVGPSLAAYVHPMLQPDAPHPLVIHNAQLTRRVFWNVRVYVVNVQLRDADEMRNNAGYIDKVIDKDSCSGMFAAGGRFSPRAIW
jgi:hypothetical protein